MRCVPWSCLVTIGPSPRVDVVPRWPSHRPPRSSARAVRWTGSRVHRFDALHPSRRRDPCPPPADGAAVFVLKERSRGARGGGHAELGARPPLPDRLPAPARFPPLTSSRPLIQPQRRLLGPCAMRGPAGSASSPPRFRTFRRPRRAWRRDGFDPFVVPLSPYGIDAGRWARVAGHHSATPGGPGGDGACMGFRRQTRDELRAQPARPVLLANLLAARVIGDSGRLIGPALGNRAGRAGRRREVEARRGG